MPKPDNKPRLDRRTPSGYDGIPACSVLSHGQAGADTLTVVKA